MHEIRVPLTLESFAAFENLLFESDELQGWNLYENFEDKGYWLQGVFPTEAEAWRAWELASAAAGVTGEPRLRELADQDWKESYKEHFQPWSIGPLHWVPRWLEDTYELPPGHQAVWLDPGMAFGTGNHATTRLCVEQLLAWRGEGSDPASASVVDAGCGSGILAISAAKLGFQRIHAFDIDEEAVRIAQENAAANRVDDRIEFRVGDLETGFRGLRYDCVLANILAKTLLDFPQQLVEATAPGGWLALSGILSEEAETVRRRFAQFGALDDGHVTRLEEWSALRFIKSRDSSCHDPRAS